MTEDEYKALVAHESSGALLVGVERPFARRFYTDVPVTRIKQETGEAPYFEKMVVWFAFISSPVALLSSFALSALAFGWWALLAIPLSAIVYFLLMARAPHGKSKMRGLNFLLVLVIVNVTFIDFSSSPFVPWYAIAVAYSFWAYRFLYAASATLLRAFILRNQRAFEFAREHIVVKETTGTTSP